MEKLSGEKSPKSCSILLSEESGSIHDIPRMKFAKCRSQRRNLIVSDCIRRRIKLLIATSHEDNLASLANPDIAALRFCARGSIMSKTVIGWFRRWLEWRACIPASSNEKPRDIFSLPASVNFSRSYYDYAIDFWLVREMFLTNRTL